MGVSTVGRILKIMKRTDKFLHSLYLKDDGLRKIIFNENKNKKKKILIPLEKHVGLLMEF